MISFRLLKKQFGVSLIEVMIGVAIVSSLLAWIYYHQKMSVQSINYTVSKTHINGLVQDLLSRISMNKSKLPDYKSKLNGNTFSCASLVNCIGRKCTSTEMVTFDIQQVMCNRSDLMDLSMTLSCATSSCSNNDRVNLKASWAVYEGESANGDDGLKTHKLEFNMSFLDGDYLPVGSLTDSVYVEPEDELFDLEGAPEDDAGGGGTDDENSANSGGVIITASDLLKAQGFINQENVSIDSLTSDTGLIFDNRDGTFTFIPNDKFDGSTIGLSFNVVNGDEVTSSEANLVNSEDIIQIAYEDFESGVNGWEGDNVYSESSGGFDTGNTMGMDSSSGIVSKEFTVPEGAETATLTFTANEVESWDAEIFQVYINDRLFVTQIFQHSDNALGTESVSSQDGNEVGTVDHGQEDNYIGDILFFEQSHYYTMTVPVNTATGKVKVGFDSSLDEEQSDERLQIDNLELSILEGWGIE